MFSVKNCSERERESDIGLGGTSITQSDYLTIAGFDLICYKRNSYFACSIAQSDFHLVYLLTYLTLFGSSYKSPKKYNICLRSQTEYE